VSSARALLVTLRPHQWVKNLFVAAPLVFAKKLTDGTLATRAAIAVLAFCALSGAVYALNDVLDAERDRAHALKRRRPVASGALSERAALWAAGILAAGALVTAFAMGWRFGAVAAGYLVLNLLYSLAVKQIPFLDVGTIALGFLLRVLGGAYAIDVEASIWLLACTALLAAFLGFGKRAHELAQAGENGGEVGRTRRVLERYNPAHLRLVLYGLAAATTAAYVVYTRTEHTIAFFGSERMIFTAPFCALGLWRFLTLAMRPTGDSPTEQMLRDPLFMANLVVWGVTVVGIIYFR
jgi:4-hydroxybenzoate polyprenyltransferase